MKVNKIIVKFVIDLWCQWGSYGKLTEALVAVCVSVFVKMGAGLPHQQHQTDGSVGTEL